MNGWSYSRIIGKYKKCPSCGSSYKDGSLKTSLESETITFSCECGWKKSVDENNNEVEVSI